MSVEFLHISLTNSPIIVFPDPSVIINPYEYSLLLTLSTFKIYQLRNRKCKHESYVIFEHIKGI